MLRAPYAAETFLQLTRGRRSACPSPRSWISGAHGCFDGTPREDWEWHAKPQRHARTRGLSDKILLRDFASADRIWRDHVVKFGLGTIFSPPQTYQIRCDIPRAPLEMQALAPSHVGLLTRRIPEEACDFLLYHGENSVMAPICTG